MITAQANGAVLRATTPLPTGEFFLARLVPGTYDVVVTANNRATAVVQSIPVTNTTSIVAISSNNAPLTLPASSTHNVNGVVILSPPNSTEVSFVTAKQTLGIGLVVTIGEQAADLLSGAYLHTLPTAAPLLGQYGTGNLPITFSAQPASAGIYTIEASANGYQSQSVNVNISTADATRDFALVP